MPLRSGCRCFSHRSCVIHGLRLQEVIGKGNDNLVPPSSGLMVCCSGRCEAKSGVEECHTGVGLEACSSTPLNLLSITDVSLLLVDLPDP